MEIVLDDNITTAFWLGLDIVHKREFIAILLKNHVFY